MRMTQGRGERAPGRSLFRQAGEHAGNGAGALFARLDALDGGVAARQEAAAALLARLAEHLRAGAWSAELAALIAQAEAVERALAEE
jgi:hypothetical protein